MLRKDYKRQLIAIAFAVVFAGIITALTDMSIWGFLIIMLLGYAGAYKASLELAALTKIADSPPDK